MPELQSLIENYYSAWFRFHPEIAVDLGVEGYSQRLTPCDEDDIGALISLNEKLIASLDELDCDALSQDSCIDIRLMYGAAMLEIENLAEFDWRRRQPARFLPINAIYQLIHRPVKDRHIALASRLDAIPAYLREARTFLREEPERIPLIWLQAGITEAQQGVDYLRNLRHHPQLTQYRLDKKLEQAAHAVEQYADFMLRELTPKAQGDFACGRQMFERLLRYRHGLDIDTKQLLQFGKRLFQRTLDELLEETRRLRGDDDITALTSQIQANHPSPGELLPAYREGMEAARQFVIDRGLVEIPQVESLKVVATPAFLRHEIPFAAYMEPSHNDPKQCGLYYVTPAAENASLGEHNHVSLRHTCVHEAWPGHHLQFVTANCNSRSSTLPRLTNSSATLYEGWALYSEQMMQEQGFLDAPGSRFVLLKDRLWRALRVILDVELHTGGLTLEQAVQQMQEFLGFTREQALADLTWYTQAPTVPMGYATGWVLITATRKRLQSLDASFELSAFHNQLLAEGSISLPYVIQSQFGEPLWQSVRRAVFIDI